MTPEKETEILKQAMLEILYLPDAPYEIVKIIRDALAETRKAAE